MLTQSPSSPAGDINAVKSAKTSWSKNLKYGCEQRLYVFQIALRLLVHAYVKIHRKPGILHNWYGGNLGWEHWCATKCMSWNVWKKHQWFLVVIQILSEILIYSYFFLHCVYNIFTCYSRNVSSCFLSEITFFFDWCHLGI